MNLILARPRRECSHWLMMRASSISAGSITCLRNAGGFRVELLDELGHDLRVRRVLRALQDEVLAADQFAAADEEDLHAGFAVGARHGQHIRIEVVGGKHDLLSLDDGLHRLELIAQGAGLLEAHFVRGLLHRGLQARHNGVAAPAQECHQVGDHLPIAGLIDRPDAGRRAELDVVVQTGSFVLAGDDPIAGQIRENASEGIQGLVDGPGRRVGAEVSRAVITHLARHRHLGVRFGPMDLDVRIALVILEADVVLRPMLLDQIHLEDQRFQLRSHEDPFDVRNLPHQTPRLGILARIGVKVRPDAVPQADGLADVDDCPPGRSSSGSSPAWRGWLRGCLAVSPGFPYLFRTF